MRQKPAQNPPRSASAPQAVRRQQGVNGIRITQGAGHRHGSSETLYFGIQTLMQLSCDKLYRN
jgi:hypothetical protein